MVISKFVFLCLCLFVVLALVPGCGGGGGGGGASDPPPATESVTVTGTVSDATSDSPVVGAYVTIEPVSLSRGSDTRSREKREAVTDVEGFYECKDVPAGDVKITTGLPDGSYQSVENIVSVPAGSKVWKWTTRLIRRDIPPPTSIVISPKDQTVPVGGVVAYTATVGPDPSIKASFTVTGGCGTISDEGVFVATKAGTGTVYARTGSIMDSTTVVVNGVGGTLGALIGTVTDTSGRPISGATVTVSASKTATTGIDGTYVIADMAANTYSVQISAPSFTTQTKTGVAVEAGKTTTIDVSLVPIGGTISGTVTKADGSRLAGVTVSLNPSVTTTTGADGRYLFANLAAGAYTVSLSATGYVSQTKPGTVVDFGRTTTLDVILLKNSGTLSGTVKDTSGTPIFGASVSIAADKTTSTLIDGTYTFTDLVPGTYTAAFTATGFVSQSKSGLLVEAGKTTTQDVALAIGIRVAIDGPNPVLLTLSETHTFTATVTNAADTRVVWSVTGGGSITPDGLYTAPATRATAIVKASSRADAKAIATVTVQVQSGGATVIIR